jgi:hypothetical protein
MELFACPGAATDDSRPAASLRTPLGHVRFAAAIGGNSTERAPLDGAVALPSGGNVLRWRLDACVAELLICRPAYRVPPDMRVLGCWSGLWRLLAKAPVGPCTFVCEWEAGHTWIEGSPAHGEGLIAETWDDGSTVVTIGTEDEYDLARRAARGDGLPRRWAASVSAPETVDASLDGLRVSFPLLPPGELVEARFTVAWAALPDNELAPWFAVDCLRRDILAGAGCS